MVKTRPIALGAALGAATVTGLLGTVVGAAVVGGGACCASELGGWGAGSMVFGCLLDVNLRVFG
jgi:hypothetical protein